MLELPSLHPYITYSIPWEIQLFTQIIAHGHGHVRRSVIDWVETGNCISALYIYQCQARGGGGGGPRASVGHLASRDPYHVPDILDLKRGWTGINNAHAIFRMHNLF